MTKIVFPFIVFLTSLEISMKMSSYHTITNLIYYQYSLTSQLTSTSSKSTIETLKKGTKYVQT